MSSFFRPLSEKKSLSFLFRLPDRNISTIPQLPHNKTAPFKLSRQACNLGVPLAKATSSILSKKQKRVLFHSTQVRGITDTSIANPMHSAPVGARELGWRSCQVSPSGAAFGSRRARSVQRHGKAFVGSESYRRASMEAYSSINAERRSRSRKDRQYGSSARDSSTYET